MCNTVVVQAQSGSGQYLLNSQVIEPLVLVVENTVITGSATDVVSGHLDVHLEVPDGLELFLAAYDVELSLDPSDTAVSLVNAVPAPNPIFPNQSPLVLTSPDPGNVLRVADNLAGIDAQVPIEDGLDLFRLRYEVEPGFLGTFELGLDVTQLGLFDGLGQIIVPVEIVNASISVIDPGPQVVEVLVSGSDWSQDMLDEVDPDLGIGFAIPTDTSTNQQTTLPWVNLDRISIRFNEAVNVATDDLAVHGINVPRYLVRDMTYDPMTFTATWTLTPPNQPGGVVGIAADRLLIDLFDGVTDLAGNALDGDYSPVTDVTLPEGGLPSGDGLAGGNLRFEFNVLPGNVDEPLERLEDQTLTVTPGVEANDVLLVQTNQFQSVGDADYSVFLDVNGDGRVFGDDVVLTRNRQTTVLPAAGTYPAGATFTVSDEYDLTLAAATIGGDGAIEGQVGFFGSSPYINGVTPPPGSPFELGWPAPQITTVASWEFSIDDPDALNFFFANPTTQFEFEWSWTVTADFTNPNAGGIPASFSIKKRGMFADLFPPSQQWVAVTVEYAGRQLDAFALIGVDAPNQPGFFEIGYAILATEEPGLFFPPGTPDGAQAFITGGHSSLNVTPTNTALQTSSLAAVTATTATGQDPSDPQPPYRHLDRLAVAALTGQLSSTTTNTTTPPRVRKLAGSAARLWMLSNETQTITRRPRLGWGLNIVDDDAKPTHLNPDKWSLTVMG